MVWLLRFLFAAILAVMLWGTVRASLAQALFDIPPEVTGNPWFQVTLFDAYFAFFTFYVWVAWKEQALAARVLWFLAIGLWGNFAMATYMLVELFRLPAYATTCDRLLKRDGLLALQFITCPDARYEQFRTGVDFIQKHIFPGSLLVSVNRLNDLLARHGGFVLHGLEDFGRDYARTLRLWRDSFHRKLDQVRALGFDDRFIRKWHYYLCYCEAAFALRNISVVHTLHTRPNNLSL